MATGLIETSSLTHELIIFCQKVDVFSDGPTDAQIFDISNLSVTSLVTNICRLSRLDSNNRLQHHCKRISLFNERQEQNSVRLFLRDVIILRW